MTKKTGLFDVDFSLTTKELTASIKGEKSTTARYKLFSEAVGTIISQMEVSGYRPRTIKDYDTVLKNFSKSTGVTYLEEITVDTIYSWLDLMQVVNQTKLTRLKVLKSFLGKCFTNGWLNLSFWQSINVKVDKKVKKGAKPNDIAILVSLIDKTTFIGLRDVTAILTMYKTGIRFNTLGQLNERNIDWGNKTLVLDGAILKNHQVLKLPIDDQLMDLYRVLIQCNDKLREHFGKSNTDLFITMATILNTKSTNNAISKQITKYAKRFSLENINAHAIRRAYAKNLHDRGASIALISKALGHSDLAVTTQYLDLDVEEVARDLREYL
ncbi:site-specific integrase [Lysinibacillus sp. OL1_EC]|uniref:tyrosine-type recombinase/integrase n=1 Tax=unclassified Lysinibacillus TaxID=2636778 RepID=UPI00103DA895|nr:MULTISPECIES: site-specific integrase [unclassified Lysinibacillus]MCM0624519.1 site-specific integrase [Lysinibacillus sp. OL1_EC]TBV88213.1 site-specific integrase [Lysinibacillus sp. OL1]